MLLFVLSYLGGVMTIVSPCILPVLPFVFARADQPFLKSGLPLLLGMAITFAGVATLAAIGGGWAVQANSFGRIAALVVLGFFGLLLLFPALSDFATRPLVALGSKLTTAADSGKGSPVLTSLLLGVATGLLWAPCAGPILGLLLTTAALKGASASTSLLLLAYAAGAATSLALALLVGGRVFTAMKKSLHAGEWVRRALGAAVLIGVVAIAAGVDTGFLTRVSTASTNAIEQSLLNRFHPGARGGGSSAAEEGKALPIVGEMPELSGAVAWINSPPLTREALRGKVVVVDFWTYSCINCLRSLPYVRAWAEKYKKDGLVVIGVHTPEFAFERDVDNVRRAVKDLGVTYPVAVDSDQTIWRAFDNEYWPAHYFIDGAGRIRFRHFGEGGYDQSERVIQRLLMENGARGVAQDVAAVQGTGVGAASMGGDRSPETYVGYDKAENFAGLGGLARDQRHVYPLVVPKAADSWSLAGDWTVAGEQATSNAAGGRILYRFHGRDLHLVLGPAANGKPVRFRVRLDGQAPDADHGVDVDAQGDGVVTSQRLYQLVRQQKDGRERSFEIEFLDPGAQAFAFTFG